MAEGKADRDPGEDVEQVSDDLELPDETAEEVKGGMPGWKRPSKIRPDKV
jgi:hypothetical protein